MVCVVDGIDGSEVFPCGRGEVLLIRMDQIFREARGGAHGAARDDDAHGAYGGNHVCDGEDCSTFHGEGNTSWSVSCSSRVLRGTRGAFRGDGRAF